MRYIFSILLCVILQSGFSQGIIKTVGISYTNGTPTYTPAKAGSALALDTVTWRYYTWNGSTWLSDGFRVQTISGCSAPAYTPTKYQSLVVINACNDAQGGPEIYKWSGSVWEKSGGTEYTAGTGIDITGGVISSTITNTSEPANQIVYGTGTGVDSSPNLKKNGDTLAVNPGNLLIRPTNNFGNYYTLNIWPKKNMAETGNFGILRIPMDSFASRANNSPLYGKFPPWTQSISWDNSINVNGVSPADTTGNLIYNQGFNHEFSDPSYNPKFPSFYWSTEWKYRAGTNNKAWTESHWEFRDTLGRVSRPITMAMGFDGTYAGVSFCRDQGQLSKGSAQAALTPGEINWQDDNYITGTITKFFNESTSINKKYSGNFIQKYRNKSGVTSYVNVIRHEANDVMQVADSAGVRVMNTLYIGQNNQPVALIKVSSSQLKFDTCLIEFQAQPGASRNFLFGTPGNANKIVQGFDGSQFFLGKYLANESIFLLHSSAPNNSLSITSAGKLAYNSGASFCDFDMNQRTDAFGGGMRFLSLTSGKYTTLRANADGHLTITGNGAAISDKIIATTNDATLFEGAVSAPPGSIGMMGGSSTGDLWVKKSGTGNTGWKKAVTTDGSAASAALEITSTTQGFLPPRMTTTQRDAISSPATGLTVYCTDCTAFDLSTGVMVTWNGATWKTNW